MPQSDCRVCRAERVHRPRGPWAPEAQGSRTLLHQPNPPAQLRLEALHASQAQVADSARGLSQLEATSRSRRSNTEHLPQLRGRSAASSAAASFSSRTPGRRQAGQRGCGLKQGVPNPAATSTVGANGRLPGTSAAAAQQRPAALLRQPSSSAVPRELVRQSAAQTVQPIPMQPLQWPVLGASTAFQAPVIDASRAAMGVHSRATSLQHQAAADAGALQPSAC